MTVFGRARAFFEDQLWLMGRVPRRSLRGALLKGDLPSGGALIVVAGSIEAALVLPDGDIID